MSLVPESVLLRAAVAAALALSLAVGLVDPGPAGGIATLTGAQLAQATR